MASQAEQVLTALKSLKGKKGTFEEICQEINLDSWRSRTPKASVGSYLARFAKKGIAKLENGKWALTGIPSAASIKSSTVKKSGNTKAENILYLITINTIQKENVKKGFPFKFGHTNRDLEHRISSYNASLPFDTIDSLWSWDIPSSIPAKTLEKVIRRELLDKIRKDFNVAPLDGGNQREWFLAEGLPFDAKHKQRLLTEIKRIVDEEIKNMSQAN